MNEDQNHSKKDAKPDTRTSIQISKVQTNILTVGFITTMLVMLTAMVIFAIADENNDWPNALTLVVELAVGLSIAVIVYIHSKVQNERMTRALEEERKFVAQALILRMSDVIRRLERILDMDTEYEKFITDKDKNKWLDIQQNMAKDILSMSDVGVDYLAMARIFDAKLAAMYRDIHIQLSFVQGESLTVDEYARIRADYRKDCENCIDTCTKLREHVESRISPSQV